MKLREIKHERTSNIPHRKHEGLIFNWDYQPIDKHTRLYFKPKFDGQHRSQGGGFLFYAVSVQYPEMFDKVDSEVNSLHNGIAFFDGVRYINYPEPEAVPNLDRNIKIFEALKVLQTLFCKNPIDLERVSGV
jgi:hypothetical protein